MYDVCAWGWVGGGACQSMIMKVRAGSLLPPLHGEWEEEEDYE